MGWNDRVRISTLLPDLRLSAIGEMDIMSVFETDGGGSIPSWPAIHCERGGMATHRIANPYHAGSNPVAHSKFYWSIVKGLSHRILIPLSLGRFQVGLPFNGVCDNRGDHSVK